MFAQLPVAKKCHILHALPFLGFISFLMVVIPEASGQHTNQSNTVNQEKLDAAMRTLAAKRMKQTSTASQPTTRSSEPTRLADNTLSNSMRTRRDALLKSFRDQAVQLRRDRAEASTRKPPKYKTAMWAEDRRVELADISHRLRQAEARAFSFEQLSLAEVTDLFSKLDTRNKERRDRIQETIRTQYRTSQQACETVMKQFSNIHGAKFLNGDDRYARYKVSYASQDGIIRAGELSIEFNAVFDAKDPSKEEPAGFWPTSAALLLPNGQFQRLSVRDLAPPEPRIDWDDTRTFKVISPE